MSIPEQPSDTSIFKPQHGYADLDHKTHEYSGDPTPFKPQQNKAADFFHDKTDKEHQKKYAKEGGKRLFGILQRILCN
ncbi:uncharacterized protein CANTADRAFT_55771 [Suhomyces tanzawaensis NRRL Y-17324]|uniref:Uncharacterized protein n=1 Tax=Suhomyces tanzawaensis NRRL Y-17324 TaxID=984487 RepID=A0A1E4SCX6_9ASCO|nr:uncharacterized protein CANTADRAFT_55771 [Suhomyces tanzawaensis NRRL Y-17324]ODV77371.1 hypothetical protein CANTADRAFT_55771 [Suhomyces tanzawaensis NRRL Y-17324]